MLVDWLVEIQENFELNHETLYLAVKLVDLYLSKARTKRERLQLVGATALFSSCKFDVSTSCCSSCCGSRQNVVLRDNAVVHVATISLTLLRALKSDFAL